MSQKNPIKFLDSYTREDSDIFFGRDKDTNKLYDKVNQSSIILLYGLSGTGKTSLINCGLENKFEEGQSLFIYVRRGINIVKSLNTSISSSASSLIHPRAKPFEGLETLYFDYLKPIIVVFDQFEELFISGNYDEIEEFIEAVSEIIHSEIKVKIIFSLREEYLAHMDRFEEKISSIYDHRHRLEKMRRVTLEEVITSIAQKGDVKLEDEKVPGMIIDNISDRKGNVELPYLQVYLDKLSRLGQKFKSNNIFTHQLVEQAGELEDVLADFLEEQINRIADEIGNKEAINFTLKQMITPDGTKKQLTYSEFKSFGNNPPSQLNDILQELELSRLIKLEDGIYELSHDSLANKVAEKRTAEEIQIIEVIKFIRNSYNSYRQTDTLLDRKQLKYITPYLEKIDPSEDEMKFLEASKRKVQVQKTMLISLGAALLVVLLGAGYYWQYQRYLAFTDQANTLIEQGEYNEARLQFVRALDVIIPNKEAAEEGLKRCDNMLKIKPVYDKLINEGNTFFSLGINHYDSAFSRYNGAILLHYNDADAQKIYSDKKEDAIIKYIEFAQKEDQAGHTDIAFSHLTNAFVLDNTDLDVIEMFQSIIASSTYAKLEATSGVIKLEYPEIIDSLLQLLTAAETKAIQPDPDAYQLIRTTISQ